MAIYFKIIVFFYCYDENAINNYYWSCLVFYFNYSILRFFYSYYLVIILVGFIDVGLVCIVLVFDGSTQLLVIFAIFRPVLALVWH